jgi:hypothetical protein
LLSRVDSDWDIVSEYQETVVAEIRLEAGKRYTMRNGKITGPLVHVPENHYPFIDPSDHDRSWLANGYAVLSHPESEWAIVSEYQGQKRTAKIEDQVNPSHYKQYPIEVADIIRLILEACPPETTGTEAYLLGNELKYRLRAGFKDPSKVNEDIDKALWYNERRHNIQS